MKQTRKRIGSLLIAVCMVLTMLPTVAFAEEGVLNSGVTLPQIKVTVKAADAPMLLGAGIQPLGTGNGTDITTKFNDANFLAEVRTALSKEVGAPIYDTDVASVKTLTISSKRITSLAGIEYFTALTKLNCSRNQLTALDVSKNTKLTELSCFDNDLTALDVSKNTALTYLSCSSNQLSELDVSNNTALGYLDCQGNQLSALEVSNNTALIELYCFDNQLSALDVSNNTAFTKLDCNGNQLSELDVSNNTALTGLWCYGNQLSALDVSKNTKLGTLNCSGNYMAGKSAVKGLAPNQTTTFIFDPQNTSTSTYSITVNSGTANPSTAVAGATVTITANAPGSGQQFKEWTVVSGGVTLANAKLLSTTFIMPAKAVAVTATYENISASGTDITDKFTDANFLAAVRTALNKGGSVPIYDTDFTSVTSLKMSDKGIKSLAGIEYFTSLTTLDCFGNDLTALDVSKNIKLTELNCSDNQLSALGVSNNTAITKLDCFGNDLTALDVSKNTALTYLSCNGNLMRALDVSKNIKLTELNCSDNQLSALGVSNNTAITKLDCRGNKLSTLDVSKNIKLTELKCYGNKLSALDVSKNIKLTELFCYDNQLSTLDVSNNTALTTLNCSKNYMAAESAVTGINKTLTTAFIFNPQKTSPSVYAIAVNSGTASPSTAAEGATVTITANTPDSGKQFKEWTVKSGGVTLFNAKASSTTFTMPANAVEVTATYEAIPAGVSVSTAAELKTALEASASQTINVTADITFTEQIEQGADHTLAIPSGKTVTASGTKGFISIGNHTLTINGGGIFVCNRNGNALFTTNGTLNLENITVNVTGGNGGILVKTINLDNSATVNLNSTSGNELIRLSDGYTLNINTGGTIEITNFNESGIAIKGGTLNINGGSLTVGKGQSDNQIGIAMSGGLLKYSSGTLNATNDAVISFTQSASAEGVSGRFIDGGYTLAAIGKINIGAADATPSVDGLTAGYYNWNSSKNAFEKQMITIEKQPQDVTVTEGIITGSLSVTASASNAGTITYQWMNGNSGLISGAVDATYTLPTNLTAGTRKYKCLITAPGCMAQQTREVTVTVNPAGGASTYAVTINNGTASLSTAAEGATVTITASTPENEKRFKEWTVDSGGVTLFNAKASSTTFTMPANAVEVTATYENIPAGVTPVTGVTLNKTTLSLYSNTSTKTANLTATITPADATDKSVIWQSSNTSVATVDKSGQITAVGNGTANIIVTTTDGDHTARCTVTVSTYTSGGGSSSGGSSSGGSSSGGSSSGGSSSGGSSTKITTTKEKQSSQPITAVASVAATAGTNGTASASISDKAVTDAISKAQTELKKQGKTENGIAVGLNVAMPKGATTLTATLSQNALNSIVSAGVTNLEINGAPVTITFDKKALTEIQKQISGNVNIAIAPQAELSKMAKTIIGTRPVYNMTVGYGDNRTVSNFGSGVATVGIPYTPANGEVIGGLYAVYVDENGNATRVAGSAYDADSGCIIFTTTHFSMYGIGYSAPSTEFADISSHWAKESIDYVVGRGLLSGTSETTFAPNTAMTRGMLVTALGRLQGVDVSSYTKNSFTDVKAGSTFQPYIEWAYEKGIIQGLGNNKFAPDRAITREEIAVIITNFAKATEATLPVTREATTYVDDSSISSSYKTAVTAMQQAGIMMGGTSNKFNPKSNATRAEVSSMLYRYMKLNMK